MYLLPSSNLIHHILLKYTVSFKDTCILFPTVVCLWKLTRWNSYISKTVTACNFAACYHTEASSRNSRDMHADLFYICRGEADESYSRNLPQIWFCFKSNLFLRKPWFSQSNRKFSEVGSKQSLTRTSSRIYSSFSCHFSTYLFGCPSQ